jgi:hypothetical protein
VAALKLAARLTEPFVPAPLALAPGGVRVGDLITVAGYPMRQIFDAATGHAALTGIVIWPPDQTTVAAPGGITGAPACSLPHRNH